MKKSSAIIIAVFIIIGAVIANLSGGKTDKVTKVDTKTGTKQIQAVSEITEDEAYSNLKKNLNIRVYKPTYTAGFKYISTPPSDISWTLFSAKDAVWYKNGDSYFHVISGLIGDFEGLDGEVVKTDSGRKVMITPDGKAALWAEGLDRRAYGIELKDNSVSKEEILKIIESMQNVE